MNALDSVSPPTIATLYTDHHGWLQGWLGRRLGNAADAADLAHDAFLRLIAKPRRFDSAPEARSYLRAMANGLCVDLWRRRSIEQAWLDTLAAQPEAVAPSAEHHAIVLETLYEIDCLLRSLPAKAAQAFVMAAACGMTYQEVAQALGVSVRMVAKYVAKATFHCLCLEARQAVDELPHGGLAPCAAAPVGAGAR
ncbi:sigma-70 family RNA polymerase sigma factor [Verticiella sediminum]|uniref:Sigma-70 family RNA polymerase sigma factor n=1 Tax=Verticiella sediminum TaxID=1247510 RepID=A0A556B286_9BURK|nr:sigma-70 family RNA polymerase sigma factor [Verticiella sediminum]TSH99270.1 sigma-70 family RNA polymerase sigma factor [Verticiella sediminum]